MFIDQILNEDTVNCFEAISHDVRLQELNDSEY